MKTILKMSIGVMFLLTILKSSLAQNNADFFMSVSRDVNTLQATQRNKLSILEKGGRNRSIQLVTVKNLAQHQREGYFIFKLPGIQENFVSKATHVEIKSDTDFTWWGVMEDKLGTVTLLSQNGELFGHIAVEDRKFELYPLGDELYALAELETSIYESEECATTHSPVMEEEEPKNPAHESSRFVDCSKHARILILYTTNAQNAVPNIIQTAQLSVNQTNQALLNSGIYGDSYVQVGMAGLQHFDFTETNNVNNDVQTLKDNLTAQNLRNTHGADLVILLTNGNYGGYAGAAIIGPNDPTSYAIVQATYSTGNYTFAHEVAHLFGARHQRCYQHADACDDNPPEYAHGYSFNYGFLGLSKCRTIMHTPRNGYTRILYFSNPNISHNGQATGLIATAHNARQLWEQAPAIATYRPSIGQLSASVDVKVHHPGFRQYTCEAVSICGVAPHTFEWRISHDGFNYGAVVGAVESIVMTTPTCTNLYVWLRIYSYDNQQADKYFTLSHFDEGCEESRRRIEKSISENEGFDQQLFSVYPNPVSDQLNIRYYLAEAGILKFNIIDTNGRLVAVYDRGRLDYGWHDITINSSRLNSGVYLLKAETKNKIDTRKITLQR